MFGKNAAKKAQEEAARRNAAADTAVTQAAQPTPLQSAWEKANLDFLNWENREGDYKDKPLDVMTAPGLGVARSLFDYARRRQGDSRQGIGALRMGLNATSPEAAANLATQADLRREQDAAGQLEEAVALKTAEAHGSVMPLAHLNTNRALGIAGLRSNNAQYAQNRADQLQQSSGFLRSPLFGALMQGASVAIPFGIGALRGGASRARPVAPSSVLANDPYLGRPLYS